MKVIWMMTGLLLSLAGPSLAQKSGSILSRKENRQVFAGQSHVEIELGQRNTLILGFDQYRHARAHQNLDSAIRLFLTDYQKVADVDQSSTQAVYAHFRLGEEDRTLELRTYPQATTSFLFRDRDEPVQLKSKQDTLQLSWRETDSFQAYFLLNNLADLQRLLQQGGVTAKVQKALEAVESYDKHNVSLTNPKMAFDLVQREGQVPQFLNPGLARRPALVISPSIGIGLIRTQWVPSLAADFIFVPNQYRRIGYSIGYLSSFSFNDASSRRDFINLGVTFYRTDPNKKATSYNRVLTGIYLGASVYSYREFWGAPTFRLSGMVYHRGLFKVYPELYWERSSRNFFPGLRLSVGL